ncbi:hypothetical protein, partial [Moritella viscosa]|uniref:hypothetical protein n=1 Tax=Moritella viscosa TaxID=80854 RepID=UPI0015B87557
VAPPVAPIDNATMFFNMDMYQNGEVDIQYNMYQNGEANTKLPKHVLSIKMLNKSISENRILHKLNFTDEQGFVHSENYVINIQNKTITKVDESILYEDSKYGRYEVFEYNSQYVKFDFNLEKGQQSSKTFNARIFDSASHKFIVVSTKVTTKYLGLDKIEAANTSYNAGKFETIEETASSKIVTTTWFNSTNGVILKQAKSIHNLSDNTVVKNIIYIVDSSVNFNDHDNEIAFSKFNIFNYINDIGNSVKENIDLYNSSLQIPVVIHQVNNHIKVSYAEHHKNLQFKPYNVASTTSEFHSDGVLSSFISRVIYSRKCNFNCSGPMTKIIHLWGIRDSFDSTKNYDSEYAGKYNWYQEANSVEEPSNYFIVIDLKAKTCQVSTNVKLNAFECDRIDINIDTGNILAVLDDKDNGGWYVLDAYINGKDNEFITGSVTDNTNTTSIGTFSIKKRN